MTCSHCGKENQDHYKFCLGCGRELTRASATPAPVPSLGGPLAPATAAAPSALETARTVLPPPPVMAAGELAGSVSPKPKGGIPWNDAPKMPPGISPSFNLAPNPLAAPGSAGARMSTSPTGTPALEPIVQSATAPAAASNGTTACPTCGKPIQPGFAFCGACGTRLAKAPSGQAAALGVQRTMFGSGMAPTPAPVAAPRGRLVLIRPDGTEGGTHPLHDGDTLIGRGQGTLFEADAYLSPRHAEFTAGPNGLVVRDLRSLNGVFLKLTGEESLESGDIFRLGQELLRFEVISAPQPLEDGTDIMGTPNPGFWGRLSVIVGRDVDGSAFPLFGDAIVLGRERGDILFPEDGYVSGTHARISLNEGMVTLQDLGSSNGTFLRLRHERNVPNGSFILMGQQLFRVEFR
ncbi:MAG: domain containing protein [Myxococcales bacterium]|nr:domain containing protein [Myxococcales bacterium]